MLNRRALVSNDGYQRTTDPAHYKVAQTVLQRSLEAGDVYLDTYSGWYNVKEETFVSETDAQLSDYKDPSTGVVGSPHRPHNIGLISVRRILSRWRRNRTSSDSPSTQML